MTEWLRLKADTHRVFGRFQLRDLLWGFLTHRTFRPLVTLRLCRMAYARKYVRPAMFLFKLLHRITSQLACIDLPWQTNADGGLKITHGWGAVISNGARIGRNVTIFHGATLGRRDRLSKDGTRVTGYPIIEDQVWIGPHAIIVGPVIIGEGSRIAGGAFVVDDVAPFSLVVGNPARVVKESCTPDVMNPAHLYDDESSVDLSYRDQDKKNQ